MLPLFVTKFLIFCYRIEKHDRMCYNAFKGGTCTMKNVFKTAAAILVAAAACLIGNMHGFAEGRCCTTAEQAYIQQ